MPLAPTLTPLQLVQSSSLPTLVQREIEQLILRGELVVGQRLNESELAIRFGISRGPVREALRALEECGLVRSEKNRGVFVRQISIAEADQIYDVREVLDELIGERVARRASAAQIAGLAAVVAAMERATEAGDVRRYHSLNLEFHDLLVDYAGNDRLAGIYRQLTKELLLFRLHGLQDGGGFAVSNKEHKAALRALAAHDGARAGALLRRHAADSRARMHRAAERATAAHRDVAPVASVPPLRQSGER
jgi:phosphonate utilization transcriptional regulator